MKLIVPLLLAICGCCSADSLRHPEANLRAKPLPYPEFSQFLRTREQVPTVYQIKFQRDSVGSKLFIRYYFRRGNEPAYRTLIVTADGISESPGHHKVWYDDHETPVFQLVGSKEWYVDEGKYQRFYSKFEDATYVFKNSTSAVPFHACSSQIRGVTGGDLVLLQLKGRNAWSLVASDNPQHVILDLPTGLDYPHCAYATSSELIVFGTWRSARNDLSTKCLIYQQSSAGYRLSEEVPMPWAGAVYDFDVKTRDALASGGSQHFAGYYRFNIKTKERARLGFAPSDDVLFLQDSVIRALDAAMRKGQ